MEKYDVGIIGGGPIGLACAIEAKKSKLTHVIWEKGVLVNSIFHFPTNMTFFSTSNLLEIGDVPFIAHGDKPTRREALEYYRRVWESWHLNTRLYEEVLTVAEDQEDLYLVKTDKSSYLCRYLILATGFFGNPTPTSSYTTS